MRFVPASLAIAPLALAITFVPARASAIGYEEAHSTGKATVGCGLLGAELVLGVEAAFGVQNAWAYVGGGVAGAAGGAVGGYFIEQEASARTSMILLAAGLTLAIPTTVAVLSATSYEPPADYLEDKPPADEPVADPPQPGAAPGTAPAPGTSAPGGGAGAQPHNTTAQGARTRRTRTAVVPPLRLTPPAIIDLSPDMLALRVPALEIRDTYSRNELAMFGVRQTAEFRLPVLSVAF